MLTKCNMILLCINTISVHGRFIIIITQFRVPKAMKYRALTYCMNITHVIGHERARSVMFHFILFLL
jgi:hypothetical protein